jgi:hypothetical protein
MTAHVYRITPRAGRAWIIHTADLAADLRRDLIAHRTTSPITITEVPPRHLTAVPTPKES